MGARAGYGRGHGSREQPATGSGPGPWEPGRGARSREPSGAGVPAHKHGRVSYWADGGSISMAPAGTSPAGTSASLYPHGPAISAALSQVKRPPCDSVELAKLGDLPAAMDAALALVPLKSKARLNASIGSMVTSNHCRQSIRYSIVIVYGL